MKKVWLFLVLSFLFTSCGKKLVTELEYEFDRWSCYVYDNNNPYSGEAWSEDLKSYKMTVDNGVILDIKYYNNEGDLICLVEEGERIFFSKKGNIITRDLFKDLYPKEYRLWKQLQREFYDRATSQERNMLHYLDND